MHCMSYFTYGIDRLDEQVVLVKWRLAGNTPQGVENVHTLCEGKPESDDRGNNMYY